MVKLLSKVADSPGGKKSLKKTAYVAFLHDEYVDCWKEARELRKAEREGKELSDAEKEKLKLLPSRFGDAVDIELTPEDWIKFFSYETPKDFFDKQRYPVANLVTFFSGKCVKDDDENIIAYSVFQNLKEDASSGLVSIIEDDDYDRKRIAGRYKTEDGEINVKVYLKPSVTKDEFFECKEKLNQLSSIEYSPKGSD